MRTLIGIAATLVVTGSGILPLTAGPKPANVPALVTFDPGGALRSDGSSYEDGEECVQAWYATPKGNFFMRTTSSSCDQVSARYLVLDLSNRLGGCPAPTV